jgi:hypothetical protein
MKLKIKLLNSDDKFLKSILLETSHEVIEDQEFFDKIDKMNNAYARTTILDKIPYTFYKIESFIYYNNDELFNANLLCTNHKLRKNFLFRKTDRTSYISLEKYRMVSVNSNEIFDSYAYKVSAVNVANGKITDYESIARYISKAEIYDYLLDSIEINDDILALAKEKGIIECENKD